MDFAALQAILRNHPLGTVAVCGGNVWQIAVL
jgi:hypothetical protein